MSSVMVGMFDSAATAQQARSKLLAAGFDSSAVEVTATNGEASSSSGVSTTEKASEGGIARFFENLFGGDDNDKTEGGHYEEAFRRGHHGVSVTARNDAEMDDAAAILNEAGAIDIDERTQQWKQEGWTGNVAASTAVSPTAATASTEALQVDQPQKLNVVEEELKVGKRSVARGGVRVFSRVVEVPVEQSVTLRTERTDVQTRAVDRPATEADFAAFKEGSIEVHDTAEEAVVAKSARVVGEVEIAKHVTERAETVRDTVRKTEVEVEQIGVDDRDLLRKP